METTPWVLQPVRTLLKVWLTRHTKVEVHLHQCRSCYSHAYTGQWNGRTAWILVYRCLCGKVREEIDYYYN